MTPDAAAGPQANADLTRLVRAAQRGDQLAMAELIDILALGGEAVRPERAAARR